MGHYIPKKVEYTFFSNAHETFSRMDHILGHKTTLNTFKRIEIISSIFSDYNGMILEINHRKKNGKRMNAWKLNNILLKKNNGSTMKSKKKSENTLRKKKETITLQNLWDAAKAVVREEFIVIQVYLKK